MSTQRYRCAYVLGAALVGHAVLAQPGPDGIDWVTVGSPDNPGGVALK